MLVVLIIILVQNNKKKKEREKMIMLMNMQKFSKVSNKTDIPSICPHCKSPNNKKSQECEWCGDKIC